MKQATTLAIAFMLGAFVMMLLTPKEKPPVAELIVYTPTYEIAIPLPKGIAGYFTRTGTNQIVVTGMHVKALVKVGD